MPSVLITGGGTRVDIDDVRGITNFSTGRFASQLAEAALLDGFHVTYLGAKGAKAPGQTMFDCLGGDDPFVYSEADRAHVCKLWDTRCHYTRETFVTYDDYADTLQGLLLAHQYDVVVLAAAVSDFKCVARTGKIESAVGFSVDFVPTEKLIGRVREFQANTFLVGFKLLPLAMSTSTVYAACWRQIHQNDSDMSVGNDLQSLREGRHHLTVCCREPLTCDESKSGRAVVANVVALGPGTDLAVRLWQLIAQQSGWLH